MNHPQTPATFQDNARAALADGTLRGALGRATSLFAERRATALEGLGDWEELRERGRAIKEEALSDLDRQLETFVARAEERGTQVHWARDAREACAVVGELVAAAGARRLVKSKSMTTEEIGLNEALETDGTLPIETDLGEWIIQLAGETPSHIIVPAIHKTKRAIADLFVEKLAIEPSDDVDVLAGAARRVLREHFSKADLGISGVNFGIAETGSILVLENEGNARMTTSLPRVHVAVMGIEKVLPRFGDLEPFLRLLPRSGTGQHLTSYQSILTGPKRAADEEGPDELHIVLLDNGRSAMLRERVTRQSLACIRCGACLNVCPVYKAIGGHAYGSVYPGPIGAVITPQLQGLSRAAQLPFASSLCGACRDVCPVKIDIPELLLELRKRVAEGRGPIQGPTPVSTAKRLGFASWGFVLSRPRVYRLLARLARCVPWSMLDSKPVARLVPPLAAWTRDRRLRPLARVSFRDSFARSGSAQGERP